MDAALPPSNQAPTDTAPVASSKSVLTIALQRAQSAVLADSANQVNLAIALYSESIRLLKEVMSRVADESTKRDTQKRTTSNNYLDPLDSESTLKQQERLAKEAKQLKKEKAKEEEARRLKVIVSTLQFHLVSQPHPCPLRSTTRTKIAYACS